MDEYEKYAALAIAEFQVNGRSALFKVLQDIALKHLGLARRAISKG